MIGELYKKREGLIRKSLKFIEARRVKMVVRGKQSTKIKQYKLYAKLSHSEYLKKAKDVSKLRITLGGIQKTLQKYDAIISKVLLRTIPRKRK